MSRFGSMIHLQEDGEYKQVYQNVREYLDRHFTRLPKVDIYYDAKGVIASENKDHQMVSGGFVIVQIHNRDYQDAMGLVPVALELPYVEGCVEMDAVTASCKPELRILYGYHD